MCILPLKQSIVYVVHVDISMKKPLWIEWRCHCPAPSRHWSLSSWRTLVDNCNGPLTITGQLGQSMTICTLIMDHSGTVQDEKGRKHPFTTSSSGQSPDSQWPSLTIRGLSMDRSWTAYWQQHQLGPDGQNHQGVRCCTVNTANVLLICWLSMTAICHLLHNCCHLVECGRTAESSCWIPPPLPT